MEPIRAEEISQIISRQIKEYEKKLDISETGTVLSVGDGIARVYGVQNAMAMELLEFPGGILGMVLNLETRQRRCRHSRRGHPDQGRRHRQADRAASPRSPWVKRCSGRVIDATGAPLDGKGPIETKEFRRIEMVAPGVDRPPARQPAHVHGPQGDRRHDAHRPGAARADHRRPPDRQDRHRHRCHHPPEDGTA